MLIGFAHDFVPAARLQFIAECDFQIAQRHSPSRPVHDGGDSTNELRQPIAGVAREERNDFRRALKREPLQTVTNSFPGRAHRASLRTLREGGEWGRRTVVIPSGVEGPPSETKDEASNRT